MSSTLSIFVEDFDLCFLASSLKSYSSRPITEFLWLTFEELLMRLLPNLRGGSMLCLLVIEWASNNEHCRWLLELSFRVPLTVGGAAERSSVKWNDGGSLISGYKNKNKGIKTLLMLILFDDFHWLKGSKIHILSYISGHILENFAEIQRRQQGNYNESGV